MTKTLPISVRLEPSVNEQLSMIASAYGRPKSWVMQQALNEFIATQSWQLAAIDQGMKAADEGRVVAHAEVEAWVKSWDGSGETPMPECGGYGPSRPYAIWRPPGHTSPRMILSRLNDKFPKSSKE